MQDQQSATPTERRRMIALWGLAFLLLHLGTGLTRLDYSFSLEVLVVSGVAAIHGVVAASLKDPARLSLKEAVAHGLFLIVWPMWLVALLAFPKLLPAFALGSAAWLLTASAIGQLKAKDDGPANQQ